MSSEKLVSVKVESLSGIALDWISAKALKDDPEITFFDDLTVGHAGWRMLWKPTEEWCLAGPIIQKANISIIASHHGGEWTARLPNHHKLWDQYFKADTPLVAAMRCFVACTLGLTVKVPEALLQSVPASKIKP